jgi:hypothetical protein
MSARAAAHRETAQQARPHVGYAERHQLLVRPYPFPAPREGPGGQHVVDEGHDHHAERRQQQLRQLAPVQIGEAGHGEPARDRSDHGNTVAGQPEHGNGAGGQQHREQQAGRLGPAPPHHQQEHQYGAGQGHRGGLPLAETMCEGDEVTGKAAALDGHAGHPAKLARDRDQRHTREVAHQDRPGQQIGGKTQPDQPGAHRQHPHQQGERRRQPGIPRRVPRRQRADRHRRHQRGRGLRAHRQRPRRAERRIDHQRGQGRPHARDRRHTRHLCIGHDLRDKVGGDGDTSQQVTTQPCPPITVQVGDRRRWEPFPLFTLVRLAHRGCSTHFR